MNAIFEIKKATRKGTPALISLWGPSGSGKTYSALKLARGLVGPSGKIGVIDTENRRAEFYADLAGGWDHLDLQPPFTPERYKAALSSFEQAGGYGCIIIDSMSHVWEGEGGVLDMADQGRSAQGRELKGLAKWKAPKIAYKQMVNYLLRAPFHVIFLLRAKEGSKQKGDAIEKTGLTPIAEKNFIYEMTVSVLLGPDHRPLFQAVDERYRCDPMIPPVKAPDALWGAIRPGEYLSEATGQAIAAWIGSGAAVDNETEALFRAARDKAAQGSTAMRDWWATSVTKAQGLKLKTILDELRALADQADREMAGPAPSFEDETQSAADHLDDPFTPAPANAGQ